MIVYVPYQAPEAPMLPACFQSILQWLRPAPTRLIALGPALPPPLAGQLAALRVAWLSESAGPNAAFAAQLPQRDTQTALFLRKILSWTLASHVRDEYYAVVRPNAFFVSPAALFIDGSMVLHATGTIPEKSLLVAQQLLGPFTPPAATSSIALGFRKSWVKELLHHIQSRYPARPVFESIFDCLVPTGLEDFCEFNTYAWFCQTSHPDNVILRSAPNLPAPPRQLSVVPRRAAIAPAPPPAPTLNILPPKSKIPKKFSQHGEQAIVAKILKQLNPPNRFCVDIAAHNGIDMSNTLAVYLTGWAGLAVEGDPVLFSALARHYARFANVGLARCMVTPLNVLSLLQTYETPKDFGYLSLDIDGYDFFVLEQILSAYRPSLIVTEINENIPPPLKFTIKFDRHYQYPKDHFQGMSLTKLMELADRHAYDLVVQEYNNSFLVPHELNPLPALTPEDAWRTGYLERPDRKKVFYWNKDVEPMYQLPPEEQLAFLNRLFEQYAGQYELYL